MRTKNLSGLFNMAFTAVYGLAYDPLKNALPFLLPALDQQPINIATLNIFNTLASYVMTGAAVDC